MNCDTYWFHSGEVVSVFCACRLQDSSEKAHARTIDIRARFILFLQVNRTAYRKQAGHRKPRGSEFANACLIREDNEFPHVSRGACLRRNPFNNMGAWMASKSKNVSRGNGEQTLRRGKIEPARGKLGIMMP